MLWQKESSERNALYVDLFAPLDKAVLEMCFMRRKSDNKKPRFEKSMKNSLAQRDEGNKLFANGEFKKAIELYNESLCLAPPGSEFAGLSYANRSICFLKLEMFDECLVDIKLAKQSSYPEHLMFKLDGREAKCLEGIESGQQKTYDIGLELSYDPDETFPCLANVLNVEKDGKGDFTVTAKEDIGAGKTISVEKAFTTYSIVGNSLKCNICLKRNTNLVPCNGCTSAMFCNDKCKNNMLYEGECGLVFSGIDDLDLVVLKEVRIILMVVDMFASADELMDFVEQTIKHEPMNVPSSLSDAKFRYRNFLNLPFSQAGLNSEHLFFMYKLALEIPKVKSYFDQLKHRRFLMHLIGLHSQITEDNNCKWANRAFDWFGQAKWIITHGIIGIRKRFFGISCAPNVMHCDHGDQSVFITIRPVKKGEQLLTYLADHLLLKSKAERQAAFRDRFKSDCKCSRCHGLCATAAQQLAITSDSDYGNVSSRQHGADGTDVQAMNEKYTTFLNKYGHIPWCDAIGKVVHAYVCFLCDKMSGESLSSDMMESIYQLSFKK